MEDMIIQRLEEIITEIKVLKGNIELLKTDTKKIKILAKQNCQTANFIADVLEDFTGE